MNIKDKIAAKLPSAKEQIAKLRKEHGSFKIAEVTVDQIYSGIRGVPIQISDISYVNQEQGIP